MVNTRFLVASIIHLLGKPNAKKFKISSKPRFDRRFYREHGMRCTYAPCLALRVTLSVQLTLFLNHRRPKFLKNKPYKHIMRMALRVIIIVL